MYEHRKMQNSATKKAKISLLKNRSYRRLAAAQFSALTAVYALSLAGVALVEKQTHSSAQTGMAILSAILPAFLGSLVAGAVVDPSGLAPSHCAPVSPWLPSMLPTLPSPSLANSP
jgi:hypothetical protein